MFTFFCAQKTRGFLGFCFLLLLISCIQVAEEEKVKVGAVLPMTGSFAFVGDDSQKAMQLALEEVADIELIVEDSAGENTKAVAAYNKLANIDGAKIVMTSTSWISNALYSQAADDKVFQVILASAAFKRSKDDVAVRFTVDVADEGPIILDYLSQFGKIGVLHMNNDYGKGWADQIQNNLADKVVAVETYAPGDQDVQTQLTKIKASEPDVLVLISTGKEGSLFAKKARELGISAQFASQRPIQGPELLQANETEGLVYSFPAHDVNHPFITKFTEKYGKEPTIFAVEAYDAMVQVVRAVGKCGEDTACLHKFFASSEYDGALGHVAFDEKGDAHYPFVLKQVKDGKFVILE